MRILLILFLLVGCGEKKEDTWLKDNKEYFRKEAEKKNAEFRRKTDLILDAMEKKYGPVNCGVCGHVRSHSAKSCTNCGAIR